MEEELAVCLRGSDSVDRYFADELTVIFFEARGYQFKIKMNLTSSIHISRT